MVVQSKKPKTKKPSAAAARTDKNPDDKKKLRNAASSPELFQIAWFITVFVGAAIALISQTRIAPGSMTRALDSTTDTKSLYSNRTEDSTPPRKPNSIEKAKR